MDNKSEGDSIEIHLAKEMVNIPRTSTTPTPVVGVSGGTKPQTIFIHKLYDMLEDGNISHLIWWTENSESFCLLPGEEFSKVLAQYFKHTNIASFIRQLNMYGFHKVNDAGQSENGGDNNVAKWEFRHLANHFRKGDVESLKLIKRRSSKNVTHNRESAKAAGGNEEDIHEMTGVDEYKGPQNGDQHDAKIHEQQHYHQTLQLQQQDQMPQPPGIIPHRHLAPIDGAPSPNVLPPLSKLPHRYQSSDKSLEGRLNEVTNSLATLRQEHHQLQTQFDLVFNEQKKSQFDLIQMVEIMQRHAVKREDDKKLHYELTNFKQVLLNKFNNLHVLHSQAQGHQPQSIHPQHQSHAHLSMTPQYNSSNLHYSPYSQPNADSIDSSNIDTQKSLKNVSKQIIPDVSKTKDGQPPYTYPEKFMDKNNLPTSLHSPHTSEVRRGFQQYPFPNMNSDPRVSSPSTPDLFGASVSQRASLQSSNTYEQRPQSIPTPNSSLSLSRLALSNSSVSSGSSYSTEAPPKLVPLPSVSELDKLIKNGGGGLPFYRMLNSYGPLKRKGSVDEETRKRQA
mmetsp:Transcript_5346/g.6126  ORF Transcript_5346/g.6126 Transcript_5346/m.6126 type:complete len:562 (-) Transcript_5346:96-1781(-)